MNSRICLLAAVAGLRCTAFAGSATWLANPSSGDSHTPSNWTPGGPPNDPADTATFDSSTVSNLLVSATTFVDGIIFNAGGGTPYAISASALYFFDSGITNNSGMTQNFVVLPLGEIIFANNASARSNTTFTVTEGESQMIFYNSSTAGNATFTINGSTQGDLSWGGTVFFEDTSSAENATFIVNGSAFHHIKNGFEEPFPAGHLLLRSSIGNATLIANGGTGTGDGGRIRFQGDSPGGTARVKVFGNGNFDISNHALPGATIGSLEGDGIVFLGGHTLTIGSNDLNTNFSGALSDDGPFGSGLPSGLTKIGRGTLTLSGTNTYTGATTINEGKLELDGSILSAITVNNGGTLGAPVLPAMSRSTAAGSSHRVARRPFTSMATTRRMPGAF